MRALSKTQIEDTTKYLCDNCGTVFWIVPSNLEGCPGCGLLTGRTDKICAVPDRDDSHIDVLVDSLHQLASEAEELALRDDVDDHMTDIIEGLRFQAKDVQTWLNEHYYDDPLDVVDPDYEGESGE